jgi:putative protease
MIELLSPAGNLEKLEYAYKYGSDAAYVGLHQFSLRARAGNIGINDIEELKRIKGSKKLYAAVNTFFHENNINDLKNSLDEIALFPFDAFIVSDLGAAFILKEYFGKSRSYHLSTQANTLNSAAVKAYKELGFSRIILGREVPLKDIRAIKDQVEDIEIETFVHGSMCMAYSGRCFISAFLSERSANQGDCAHSCRWQYSLNEHHLYALEEATRPGEYFPVFEEDGLTTILSSKDLCMIDHLKELKDAGVDSFKIEGRMKSLYYVASVTRAYRKGLDLLENKISYDEFKGYRDELFNVSHREFSTGFFFDKEQIAKPTEREYLRDYLLIGTVGKKIKGNLYELKLKNKLTINDEIEYIGADILSLDDKNFTLFDEEGNSVDSVNHHQKPFIQTKIELQEGFIIRKRL